MAELQHLFADLYSACRATPPCLLPNRIREALIQCGTAMGDDPPHSEDDSTPETRLRESASAITGLLENLGHYDADGLESFPEWYEAQRLAEEINALLPSE